MAAYPVWAQADVPPGIGAPYQPPQSPTAARFRTQEGSRHMGSHVASFGMHQESREGSTVQPPLGPPLIRVYPSITDITYPA